jgi:hypothetical protein
MFEQGRAGSFEHEQAKPIIRLGQAVLAGIQKKGQVLGAEKGLACLLQKVLGILYNIIKLWKEMNTRLQ